MYLHAYLRKEILKKTFQQLLFGEPNRRTQEHFKDLIKESIWTIRRPPSLNSLKRAEYFILCRLLLQIKLNKIVLSSLVKSLGGLGSTVKRYTN